MHFRESRSHGVRRTTRTGVLAIVLLASHLSAPDTHGQSEQGVASVQAGGLNGLLPVQPPRDLITDLEGLPDTWKTWTEGTIRELNIFYGETPHDIAAQRAALGRLRARLNTIATCLAESRYESIWDELKGLHGALHRRIALLEAILGTLSDHETKDHANSARQRLVATLDSVDAYLDWAIGGSYWKTYLKTEEVRRSLSTATDNAALLKSLQRSRRNLRFARKSQTAAVREFSESPALKGYLRDIDRVVAALERQTSGTRWTEIRAELKQLVEGLEQYEESKLTDAAAQVRWAYDRLRDLAPDGGDRLTGVLRQHYFNSNFQAVVSEGFLNRLMAKSRVDVGGVRDFILGADVYGEQTTASHSTVDLLPADVSARLRILLSGNVNSHTEAFASKAVIYSVGNHHFSGAKDVFFDGTLFSTSPAIMDVTASNTPVGASTRADGIPIFGGIARRLALRGANRNRPEAEAIAAERVDSRVGPQFNSEVESAFAQLNSDLRDKVTVPLKSERLYPDYKAAMTTDSEFILSSRLMSESELGGGTAPPDSVGAGDVLFSFHETLLNNALDRLPVAGKTMTEPELQKLVNQKVKRFFPEFTLLEETAPKADKDASEPRAIIFAEKDPLRVKFANGSLLLLIRAGFERDSEHGGNIPPHVLTIPWTISLAGNQFVMTRGDIAVEPVMASENVAQQLITAGVIKSRMTKSFPDTRRSTSSFNANARDVSVRLRVAGVILRDGWLSVLASAEPG